MSPAFLLLLPLALKSPWPIEQPKPTPPPVDTPAVANVVGPDARAPAGYVWNVDLSDGRVRVEAPIAVVETVLPLPLLLSTTVQREVDVDVCESHECLLPKRVTVRPGEVVHVDALFSGRGPRLRVDVGGGVYSCCDRALATGRAVAFAGPEARSFAFASQTAEPISYYGAGLLPVDVGTFLRERPDLMGGFGAILVDDGWAPAALAAPLLAFVASGGVLSMRDDDARALGLLNDSTNATVLDLAVLPGAGAYGVGAVRSGDRVAMRVEERSVLLATAADRVVAIGAGTLIVRAAGRSEEVRLSQVLVARPAFHALGLQLDPRSVPVVHVAAAGLAPQPRGAVAFSLAIAFVLGIGLVLWRGLRHGPVVAARRALIVGVVGAGALLGLRVVVTANAEVRLAHWGPGDGSRRVVLAFARAPGSFGEVDLVGAPWPGPPTTTTLVGRTSYRNHMSADGGRVHATLSSSAGLVGLWFTDDATPGALRLKPDGSFENGLPHKLDWMVMTDPLRGEGSVVVVADVAAGARVTADEAVGRETFGSVLEERFARDALRACVNGGELQLDGRGACAIGLFTRDGVLTAVQVSR